MELKTYFAQDAAGNIISSAVVNVFLQGTTTLATGLTRADGTPLENPFAADGAGRIQFRAPDGYYDVQVSAGSGIIQTLTIQCVDYSGAKADADRAEAAADRADASAGEVADAVSLRGDLADPSKGDELLAVQIPFPGSAIRTQHDKNAETVSVKDFGAKGDGLEDDTASIQKALNSGGFIIIPPGRYKITGTLRIYSDTCLFGMGSATFSYENSSTDWRDSAMLINGPLNGTAENGGYGNTKNISIIGIEFDGTQRATLGQMVEHIAFAHHENLLIESCVFRNYA